MLFLSNVIDLPLSYICSIYALLCTVCVTISISDFDLQTPTISVQIRPTSRVVAISDKHYIQDFIIVYY